MKLTDALIGEHATFYILFDEIEDLVTMEDAGVQWRGATTVLEAMVTAHATLEDKLLFCALEPHLGAQSGPLAVMRAEHDEMAQFVSQMLNEPDIDRTISRIPEALAAARGHFRKEEQVLFPLAERLLGARKLTELGLAWAKARGVTIQSNTTAIAEG